jgi:hypothetical protein
MGQTTTDSLIDSSRTTHVLIILHNIYYAY